MVLGPQQPGPTRPGRPELPQRTVGSGKGRLTDSAQAKVLTTAVVRVTLTVPPGVGNDVTVPCGDSLSALGGGYVSTFNPKLFIDSNRPSLNSTGWRVHAMNLTNVEQTVLVYANCADVPRTVVNIQFPIPSQPAQ